MIYVGCNHCGTTCLWVCVGNFWPHAPVPITKNFWGLGYVCTCCNVFVQPTFMCGRCGVNQWIYFPGSGVNLHQLRMMGIHNIAPAANANPGASSTYLNSVLKDTGREIMKSIGKEVGSSAGHWLSDVLSGVFTSDNQNWQP